ncbi:MAG: hypothetical protein IPL45_03435 [Actinomycetales bacterium]|nr:hypothetical protein [Actinomycetales bacterium]
MLVSGLHEENGQTVMLVPPLSAADFYTTSLALVAAGPQVRDLVEKVGPDLVAGQMREGLTPRSLATSVAGPAPTAVAVLRADDRLGLLSSTDRSGLTAVLDEELAQQGGDVYVAAARAELAHRLGHRVQDADAKLIGPLASVGCTGSEALFALGAAVPWIPEQRGCAPAQVRELWSSEAAKLSAALNDHSGAVGLGEAEALVALAVLSSPDQRATIEALLRQMDTIVAASRVTDVTPVAADLARAADVLKVTRTLPGVLRNHLELVVRGTGEAVVALLDTAGVALVLRTVRALGGSAPSVATVARDPIEKLDLALAMAPQGGPSADLVPEVTVALGDPAALAGEGGRRPTVVLRALSVVGPPGCNIPGALQVARTFATTAPATPEAGESLPRAWAIRLLTTCGFGPEVQREREILMSKHGNLLGSAARPGGSRPGLVEAWQAASVMCALSPESIPQEDYWLSYRDEGTTIGGARDSQGSYVDLTATFYLATLTDPDRSPCVTTGVLG